MGGWPVGPNGSGVERDPPSPRNIVPKIVETNLMAVNLIDIESIRINGHVSPSTHIASEVGGAGGRDSRTVGPMGGWPIGPSGSGVERDPPSPRNIGPKIVETDTERIVPEGAEHIVPEGAEHGQSMDKSGISTSSDPALMVEQRRVSDIGKNMVLTSMFGHAENHHLRVMRQPTHVSTTGSGDIEQGIPNIDMGEPFEEGVPNASPFHMDGGVRTRERGHATGNHGSLPTQGWVSHYVNVATRYMMMWAIVIVMLFGGTVEMSYVTSPTDQTVRLRVSSEVMSGLGAGRMDPKNVISQYLNPLGEPSVTQRALMRAHTVTSKPLMNKSDMENPTSGWDHKRYVDPTPSGVDPTPSGVDPTPSGVDPMPSGVSRGRSTSVPVTPPRWEVTPPRWEVTPPRWEATPLRWEVTPPRWEVHRTQRQLGGGPGMPTVPLGGEGDMGSDIYVYRSQSVDKLVTNGYQRDSSHSIVTSLTNLIPPTGARAAMRRQNAVPESADLRGVDAPSPESEPLNPGIGTARQRSPRAPEDAAPRPESVFTNPTQSRGVSEEFSRFSWINAFLWEREGRPPGGVY